MAYINIYKRHMQVKKLDKWLKAFLMKNCMNNEKVYLTPTARTLLRNRLNELSYETLKLIVASSNANTSLFHLTMNVMPKDLLLMAMENYETLLEFPCLSKERFEELVPELHDVVKKRVNEEHSLYSIIETLLQYDYTWEHGRFIYAIARQMVQHSRCTPERMLELLAKFPKLNGFIPAHSEFRKFLLKKKLKIVAGENYNKEEKV